MSQAPPRSMSNPKMPAVGGEPPDPSQGFGNIPTNPGMPPLVIQQAAPPPPPPSGLTIPMWTIQIIPLLTLIAGAVMVFAVLRADVEQLKNTVAEVKVAQQAQPQGFVSRQIFEMKTTETEKSFDAVNARLDRIETLINGIYERLPAKSAHNP